MTDTKGFSKNRFSRFPTFAALVSAAFLCAACASGGGTASTKAASAPLPEPVSIEISHPESEVLVRVKGKDLARVHDEAYKAFVGDLERIAKSRDVRFSKFAVSIMETSDPGNSFYRIDYRIRVSAAGKAKPHKVVDMRGTVWKETGKAKAKAQARATETVTAWEPKMRKEYVVVGKEVSSSGNANLYHVATMLYGTGKRP